MCKSCDSFPNSYFVSPIREIDFNKPDLSDNTVLVNTGNLFNNPATFTTIWAETLKVSDFRYVKRVTLHEAILFSEDFFKGQTDSDGETSEDDAGYEEDGNKYLSDTDIEMSEEKFR
jgi:hypothetical protein